MPSNNEKLCLFCMQNIHKNASLCHHCGSRQKKSFWVSSGEVFKYLGGLTAIITLIIGTTQIKNLVKESQKKQITVNSYVTAAAQQFKLGDRVNSQRLLQRAIMLDPSSEKVRELILEILMNKLQSLYPLSGSTGIYELHKKITEKGMNKWSWFNTVNYKELKKYFADNEADMLFSIGASAATGPKKAKLLSHHAWLKCTLYEEENLDITELLSMALKENRNSVHANAMMGAWILSRRNKKLNSKDRPQLARKYFEKALEKSADNLWVWSLWYKSLSATWDDSRIERFSLATEMRKKHIPLDVSYGILRSIFAGWAGYHGAPDPKKVAALQAKLADQYSYDELIDHLNFHTRQEYGCLPGPDCKEDAYRRDILFKALLYACGWLHEQTGKYKDAIEAYRIAQITGPEKTFSDELYHNGLKRSLQKTGRRPIQLIKYSSDRGELQDGDLILTYRGKRVEKDEDPKEIEGAFSGTEKCIVEIIRDGNLINIPLEKTIHASLVTEYVVPEDLLPLEGNNSYNDSRFKEWFKR